jgi:hypothetical protein
MDSFFRLHYSDILFFALIHSITAAARSKVSLLTEAILSHIPPFVVSVLFRLPSASSRVLGNHLRLSREIANHLFESCQAVDHDAEESKILLNLSMFLLLPLRTR